MKQTGFLSEEAKKKIAELQSEITAAKEKIELAMKDDLGINYILWNFGKFNERMDFSKSLDVIYSYLEVIKNCYAAMDEIAKKSIETKIQNEEKKEYTEVNWAKALSDAVKCMNNYNNQSEIPQVKYCMYVCDEAKSIPSQAVVQSKNCDNTHIQEIKIGDRVKLRGDSNSPTMTVVFDVEKFVAEQQGVLIGKGVQQETSSSGVFECNYFITDPRNENYKELRQHRFHKDALEKLIPTQPKTN